MTSTYFSAALIKNVQLMIDNETRTGPRAAWKAICEVLDAEGITYFLHNVNVDDIIVHPKNRGGLGLNAFNVQSNFEKIKRVGADKRLLQDAAAMEMPPLGAAREEAFEFNRRLVARSGGMLAPVSGRERLQSLGTGHCAAGFKAARAGCKTSTSLADSNGCYSRSALSQDDLPMKDLIDNGWSFVGLCVLHPTPYIHVYRGYRVSVRMTTQ